jgi:hypothetical protein
VTSARSSIGDAVCESVLGRLTGVIGDSHRPPRSGCAINAAIEVLGDPWSMLVLRDVIFGNWRHFRDLLHGSEVESDQPKPASRTGPLGRAASMVKRLPR